MKYKICIGRHARD